MTSSFWAMAARSSTLLPTDAYGPLSPADLAAVANCATEHARKWNLPKRGMAGTTRVKATFTIATGTK